MLKPFCGFSYLPLVCILYILNSCNGSFYHPDDIVHSRPSVIGLNFEDIYYQSESGNTIHGRFFKTTMDSSQGLIVHFHGNAENLTSHYLNFSWLIPLGYDYFIWDYSGYGESNGEPSRKALYQDAKKTIEVVSTQLLSPNQNLIYIGQSLGGAVLIPALADSPHKDLTSLVIIDSSFPDYQDVAFDLMKRSWLTFLISPLSHILLSDEYSPIDYIDQIKNTKFLVSHCKDDNVVPFESGEELYQKIPSPFKIQMDECGHISTFSSNYQQNRLKLLQLMDKLKP